MMRAPLLSLLFVASAANAQFATGQILTAQQLNNQFALYLPLAGGALTGPLTVPTLTVTNGISPASIGAISANSVIANSTASSASPVALSIPGCSTTNSAMQYTSGTGFTCITNSAILGANTFTAQQNIAASNAAVVVNDTSGANSAAIYLQNNGTNVWRAVKDSSQNFAVSRYVSGTLTDTPISVSNSTGIAAFVDGITVKGTTVLGNLSGTSSSIGGSALAAGACATGTVSVSGSTTSMAVAVAPVANPGTGFVWEGYVSASGTVTVNVCAIVAGTPTATTYNVRVAQ